MTGGLGYAMTDMMSIIFRVLYLMNEDSHL